AAHRLARAGAAVTVLEAAARVGGRLRTDDMEGARVDAGVQLLGSMFTETLRLARDVGAHGLLARSPGRDALWSRGRAHEVVYGSAASMLASGALPFGTKMRLGATYMPFLHRHDAALSMGALERAAAAGLDRESIAAWGGREMGRDFVELLAAPLLASFYGMRPEETSAGLYHALAHEGRTVEVLAVRGGAGALADAVAAAVRAGGGEIRLGVVVRGVEPGDEGVTVVSDAGSETYDAVVLAAPAPAAREVLAAAYPAAAERLAPVTVRPTATVALLLDRPLGVRYFGLSFPRGESRAVAAVCVQENKAPGLVPQGSGLLVAIPTPEAGERLFTLDAQAALDTVLPDLARVFPGIERLLLHARLFRWRHGWTLFPPGSLTRLAGLRRDLPDADGRIALAGDYLRAPTVEGAVASGIDAAERIARRLALA
ncbi:MAG: Protoporphyrinogen oxidase, partial [Gemmatimonadetes bacterium]|nr:Protoporphyrinogen oxidase [Gemmatimonadota bacterium]